MCFRQIETNNICKFVPLLAPPPFSVNPPPTGSALVMGYTATDCYRAPWRLMGIVDAAIGKFLPPGAHETCFGKVRVLTTAQPGPSRAPPSGRAMVIVGK